MSEETKKTAEAPEQEAKETEAAPQEAPETAAAPEKEAEAEPADAKKKDGWFNKKARAKSIERLSITTLMSLLPWVIESTALRLPSFGYGQPKHSKSTSSRALCSTTTV